MVTVVQGKVCAKNHPDRLSRFATIHQRYRQTDRQTDGRISYGIGLDLTVGQKLVLIVLAAHYYIYNKYYSHTDTHTYSHTTRQWQTVSILYS